MIKGEKVVTKKDVNKCFRELRDFHNILLLNFSTDRNTRGNFKGKTDYEAIAKSFIVMIELKLHNDTLKIEQVNYGKAIVNIDSDKLIYVIATHENYINIKSAIVRKDIAMLKVMQCQSFKILLEEENKIRISEAKKLKKLYAKT